MERRFRRILVSEPCQVVFRGRAHTCLVRDASAEGLCLLVVDGRTCRRGETIQLLLGAAELEVKVVRTRHGLKAGTEIGVLLTGNNDAADRQAFAAWMAGSSASTPFRLRPRSPELVAEAAA